MKKLFFTALFFTHCSLPYYMHLGKEQARILGNREKINEAAESIRLTDSQRKQLKNVMEFRKFAIDKLALNPEGGFLYFTDLGREEIGWNVSGVEPLKFQSYLWSFPFAGEVPYKGFFNLELAKKEEHFLKSLNLDTRIRAFGGYSTLGWFSDPVLSPQLLYSEANLGGLVFHEMAHATVYIKGDSNFNESYASFVEEKGIEIFYKLTEGSNSQTLKNRSIYEAEQKILITRIREKANTLNDLYQSDKSDSEKSAEKKKIIQAFKENLATDSHFKTINSKKLAERDWNNEDFIGALRYHSGTDFFPKQFIEAGENFFEFHKRMKAMEKISHQERQKMLGIPIGK